MGEDEQSSLDSTCRRFHRFSLNPSAENRKSSTGSPYEPLRQKSVFLFQKPCEDLTLNKARCSATCRRRSVYRRSFPFRDSFQRFVNLAGKQADGAELLFT
jgi:hypothetical protein